MRKKKLLDNGSRELQCGWKTVEIHGFPGNVPDRFFRVGLQNEYIFKNILFCNCLYPKRY